MDYLADTTTFSWIIAEVDQALGRVRQVLAEFEAAPAGGADLGACREHLHQVSGALNMVGLSGAAVFCDALERGLASLAGSRPGVEPLALIDRGVLELKSFVDGVARGEPNMPMRLYQTYRELAGLHGRTEYSEKDLFFPELSTSAVIHPTPSALEMAELPAFLQVQRARFQRGWLAWLRRRSGGLEDMRAALDAMHSVAAQLPERRAVWWVAVALVDALQEEGDSGWLIHANSLCSRLDFQMRDLAAGSRTVDDALLRELLYAIAHCDAHTQRLDDVRQLYLLDYFLLRVNTDTLDFVITESVEGEPARSGIEAELHQANLVLGDLESRIARLRIQLHAMPFAMPGRRRRRVVRQVVRKLGRKAELDIQGAQTEADRAAPEHIAVPRPSSRRLRVAASACIRKRTKS